MENKRMAIANIKESSTTLSDRLQAIEGEIKKAVERQEFLVAYELKEELDAVRQASETVSKLERQIERASEEKRFEDAFKIQKEVEMAKTTLSQKMLTRSSVERMAEQRAEALMRVQHLEQQLECGQKTEELSAELRKVELERDEAIQRASQLEQ